MQDKSIVAASAEPEWIPSTTVPLTDEQAGDLSKLIEMPEQDEVFHRG